MRVRRTIAEKRRIVELTLQPGMSVSRVAQAEGVNSHQVFDWRRAYREGHLVEAGTGGLVPVVIGEEAPMIAEPAPALSAGSIHIEFPGRALVTIESGVDAALAGAVIERLTR